MAMRLRHVFFTRLHFLVSEFQTEKFSSIDQHLRERGTFAFTAAEQGRQRTVRTPELEDRILDDIAELPGIGMRRIAAAECIAHSTF
jgi:hypothetical protein